MQEFSELCAGVELERQSLLYTANPVRFQLQNAFEVPGDQALGHDLALEKPESVDVRFPWGFVYHRLRHFVLVRICGL